MSRPTTYGERNGTAIRFEKELHEQLKAAAAERDVSINWLVNRACRAFLAQLVPVDELIVSKVEGK